MLRNILETIQRGARNERLFNTINGHCISWCYASIIILLLMGDSIMTAYKLTIHTLGTNEVAFTRIYETLEESLKILNQFKEAGITGTIMDCMNFEMVTID